MSEDATTEQMVLGLPVHAGRAAALSELHARPFSPIEPLRLIVELAFLTTNGGEADRAALAAAAKNAGAPAPAADARHLLMALSGGLMRWEQHAEFSTWRWEGQPRDGGLGTFVRPQPAPGELLAGVRVEILTPGPDADRILASFEPSSHCQATVDDGAATIATDFRQDGDGLTRMLIVDRGLSPARLGALAQRLIEIETYRTLALLALPLARSLAASTDVMEAELTSIAAKMQEEGRNASILLDRLTGLAARLEAETASSLYRFGASRAYYEIVEQRLASIREESVKGYLGWSSFLRRRLSPAMRTCQSVETRQENLSQKLSRATMLLRSWVEVDLQHQNSELLASMNRRAQLQLRLQQTVEGLSVAAVSYYVIGLVGYVLKGAEKAFGVSSTMATAAAVPIVLVAVWWTVRRIRLRHGEH